MIVRGLTLFKQLWLSSENGITMLAPGLCPYLLRSRPDVRICYYPPSRDFSNVSVMFTGNAYGGPNVVWDTVAYGVFVQHMQMEAHRNRPPSATPEEGAFGRGTFLAMLDILKARFRDRPGPDLVQTALAFL